MFSSYLTEVALRKSVLNLGGSGKSIEEAQDTAISHANELVKGQYAANKQGSEMRLQQAAIVAAMVGIKIAWDAMNEQISKLGRARLDFDKESKSGIATFLIPENIESRDLASEQESMQAFLKASQSNSKIFSYMGLKVDKVKHDLAGVDGTFISSIPYYEMSQFLSEPLDVYTQCEKARQAISLFFQTKIPKFINDINLDFEGDSKFLDFFRSSWRGKNFLNNYRGPRLIIMTLANLLWNLQHPVDLETGFQLGMNDKIALCRDVGAFINRLLDPHTPPYLNKFDHDGELTNYVLQIETYVLDLKDAYQQEQLHSLNLSEVTSHAHGTARILDENIFKIIYDKNEMAKTLASNICYLNLLLKRDPGILSVLSQFKKSHCLINNPPKTVIDILLVFTQLRGGARQHFLDYLNKSKYNTRTGFALTLKNINRGFFKPIYHSCLRELKPTVVDNKKNEALKLAFYRFLPLVGLVISDYKIEVDTDRSMLASSRSKKLQKYFLTGKQQIDEITRTSFLNKKNKENSFSWDLSTYVSLGDFAEDKLNELPHRQYKIGHLTNLLDSLQSFISQYKSFLQYSKFKEFVIDSLKKIGREFSSLKELLTDIEHEINTTTTENRRLISTILAMDDKLVSEISNFTSEINSIEDKMLAPDFEDNIKREIVQRLSDISDKFNDAFGDHDPSLTNFMEKVSDGMPCHSYNDNSINVNSRVSNNVSFEHDVQEKSNASQITKVSALIIKCYHGLSSASKNGVKGRMLLDIHQRMSEKYTLTTLELKQISIELTRIVCAYRPSLFFQASYGQTKSAKILLKAISKNLENDELPLSKWLFGEEFDLLASEESTVEKALLSQLNNLKIECLWSSSSSYLSESRLLA